MSRPWPWRDTPLQRRERVAQSYRAALEAHAPDVCAAIDAQMIDYGQRWVAPVVATYSADDLLTVELVADYAGVTLKTAYVWVSRGLPNVRTPDGIRVKFSDLQRWCGGERGR